ncbi:uncharacterized protein ATNIH1004_009261 [Aspergillus tanneri]|uniref:Tse2 ADP-ribosyltransferase toxin domain-containing protein n=1 Tax=Aspergillus tanneri TaxID=1220188 RepID=A0A5M9MI52_9EURO|nr:uncharacterized protein ATNIH1004_009261 [Aspergillus tanneri]KAA8645050.1 hypothetical protein ATNIH1004_009261 [Aspergillus tanneri]
MHRFQMQPKSQLFDFEKQQGRYVRDSLVVSEGGLVFPKLSGSFPYSNGPVFRPNTCLMQELLRTDYDRYDEEVEGGYSPADPQVVSIKKGTEIPESLVLFREDSSRFSLQPSRPLLLDDFNNILDEFYSTSAILTNAADWMETHEYHNAFADNAEEVWIQH